MMTAISVRWPIGSRRRSGRPSRRPTVDRDRGAAAEHEVDQARREGALVLVRERADRREHGEADEQQADRERVGEREAGVGGEQPGQLSGLGRARVRPGHVRAGGSGRERIVRRGRIGAARRVRRDRARHRVRGHRRRLGHDRAGGIGRRRDLERQWHAGDYPRAAARGTRARGYRPRRARGQAHGGGGGGAAALALQPRQGLLSRDRVHQGPGDRVLHAHRAGAAAAPARPPPDAQALSGRRGGAVLLREAVPGPPARLGPHRRRVLAPERARDRLLPGRRPRDGRVAGQPRRPRAAHAARARRARRSSRPCSRSTSIPGPPATIVECAEVACRLRDAFDHFGLVAFPKTSGSKGMQLYVPLNTPTSYRATKPFAQGVAQVLERRHPELVVSEMRKDRRRGQGVHRLEPERRAQDDGLRLLAARARAPDGLDAR